MTHKYTLKKYEHDMARSIGKDVNISFKQAVEISNLLRNKELSKARTILLNVLQKKYPVPFKRFTNGIGHKAGISSGRYPIKASRQFLKLINEVEANAQNKGLGKCKIIHISAQQASRPFHYGRMIRRRMKRAHVEIVVKEIEPVQDKRKKSKKEKTKVPEKPEQKTEAKQATKQEAKPAVQEKTEEKKAKPVKPKEQKPSSAEKPKHKNIQKEKAPVKDEKTQEKTAKSKQGKG